VTAAFRPGGAIQVQVAIPVQLGVAVR